MLLYIAYILFLLVQYSTIFDSWSKLFQENTNI